MSGITREVHKKTGQVIYDVRRTGGRNRYDTVTYVARDEDGNRVEISASDYRNFIPAYKIGDAIEDHPDFRKVITNLTKKSANMVVGEITLTYRKDVGINRKGSSKVWTVEFDGRIVI